MATSPSKIGRRHNFASPGGPVGQRLSIEITKPKDWGAFQRNCVVLFREELRDPNAKEYGRNGQDQGGIDILGHRGGDPAHPVGVQCRLVTKSLKHAKTFADCRAALALAFGLQEIIFATTAPNDTKAEQAAKAVERELHGDGHDVTVHLYGWDQLQLLIGLHQPAYNAFVPSSVATTLPVQISDDLIEGLADLDSPRPVTFMYMTALAEARRDGAFRAALTRAAAAVREHPDKEA